MRMYPLKSGRDIADRIVCVKIGEKNSRVSNGTMGSATDWKWDFKISSHQNCGEGTSSSEYAREPNS